MKTVDRGDFTQKSGHAYQDSPQLIGYGVTISAPHMVKKTPKIFLFCNIVFVKLIYNLDITRFLVLFSSMPMP